MEKNKTKKITTTIQGHKVALIFADKSNPYVAKQVKYMLISNYTQQKTA